MKKININPKQFGKSLLGLAIVAAYWYWVNQRILSDSGQAFGLISFFLLMSAATAFFPLPANIMVLGAVKDSDPLLVALVGGTATLVAYLAEYLVFTLLFKSSKVANFRNSWLYQQAAPLFDRQKFTILAFASFLPIPSEPLRIYAITQKYSPLLFMLAGFIGRMPRYFLLGYYGKEYVNSVWFVVAVFVFPALLLVMLKGGVHLGKNLKRRSASTSEPPDAIPASSDPQ